VVQIEMCANAHLDQREQIAGKVIEWRRRLAQIRRRDLSVSAMQEAGSAAFLPAATSLPGSIGRR
jgi:hypothetical protein